MSGPAMEAVRVAMLADEWPTPLAVAAMLRESGCAPAEARDLVVRYAASLPEPSGEAGVLDALRGFSLG